MAVDGSVKFDTKIDHKQFEKDLKSMQSVSKKAFSAIGLAAGALATGVAAVGINFESAFAGVKKTVNATESELNSLRKGIRDMAKEIPTAADEIAGIAEAAGQLGIKTQNILEFSRVMADLGVATNLAGEEAASTLAKFANITQMPQEKFSNLGSTIVALGNNLATTEADIAAMGLRLAGAGSQAGMSEANILSFSGALSSVGIEAEAGGTAFSKLMTGMQLAVETGSSELNQYASVAGMTGAQFKKAFKEDASGAIIEFIKGLGNAERNGKSTTEVLADMGITEIRLSDALKRAAGASDVFANAVELGNKAWEENNALTKEAEQRYQTTESKIKILGNQVKDLGITAWDAFSGPFGDAIDGVSEKVEDLAVSMESGELSGAIENVGELFGSLIKTAITLADVALPPLVSVLGFVGDNFGLIAGVVGTTTAAIYAYKGAVTVANAVETVSNGIKLAHAANVSGLNIAIGLLNGNLLKESTLTAAKTVAEGSATTATEAHTAAQTALNTAMSANPIGLVIARLAALAVGTVAVVGAVNKAEDDFLNMGDAVDEAGKKFEEAKTKAELTDDYAAKWRDVNEAISNGKLPADELAQAESKRKEYEQWFIDNYGDYISAEEQKNGIRQETIDKLREENELLVGTARLEAENAALEMKSDLPELAEKVNKHAQKNKILEETNSTLTHQNNVMLKALNEWENWCDTSYDAAKEEEKVAEILNAVNEELGTQYFDIAFLESGIRSHNKTIDENTKKKDKKKKKMKDGKESLQAYADNCRRIVESDLGESLTTFGEKFDLVKKAQQELDTQGKITKETMDKLKQSFPDIAAQIEKSEDPGATLNGIMGDLNTKLDTAKETANEFGVELNGLPKNVVIDVKLNVPEVPQFANGTPGAHEGPAVVNDGNGPELIQSKDGSFRMVQSKGAVLTYLNEGDRVYTAEQSRSMLRRIPRYANGIGNHGTTVSASTTLFGIPALLGKTAKELAETFTDNLGDALSKGLKENAEKMTEKFDKAVEVLDLQLEFGHIDEKQYFKQLKTLRDEYLAKGTKEWYDTTQEIYEHITETVEEAKDNYLDTLEYELDMGLISEREYYAKLKEYRDTYLEEGTDEWRNYTSKIFNYYKDQAEEVLEEVTDKQEDMLGRLEDHTRLTKTITVENFYEDGSSSTWNELNTSDRELKEITKYVDNLDKVEERLAAGGYDENFIKQHMDKIRQMSVDEGLEYTNLLLDASEDTFRKHIDIQQETAEAIKSLSVKAYEDEYSEAINESVDIWKGALEAAGFEVPEGFFDIGVDSATEFCEGFERHIESLFAPIRDKVASLMSGLSFIDKGNGNYTSQSSYSPTIHIYSSQDTTSQQLIAAREAMALEKLRGNY